jgi:hypothetical protein
MSRQRHDKPVPPERREPSRSSTALVVQHSPQSIRGTGDGLPGTSWSPDVSLDLFHELHSVWMQLRVEWAWLAVVPADESFSTAQMAKALSLVGAKFSGGPVDFIEGTNVDLDSSSWIIGRLGTMVAGPDTWRRGGGPSESPGGWTRPVVRTVVSLDNPVVNPLALPVALASDGIVLCVRKGRTSLAQVRRTIETVGANHIVCCVLID